MKTASLIPTERARSSRRATFNPIRHLTPETLTRMLDSFHAGELRQAALAWEAIEQRDDLVKAVATKRKKAVGRFGWEIESFDDSEEARRHAAALKFLYRQLTAAHACDLNEIGGFSLLVRQMMDAVGKRYAVHEIVWQPVRRSAEQDAGEPELPTTLLTAQFRFVPLWFMENRTGRLRFLESDTATQGRELEQDGWLVTTGDGLMEATAIAYLFKHLPLRDWLVYCERNGMPGVRGVTDAAPGTPEWEAARDAVRDFGAEFHALMSRGTEIEAIDLRGGGELPYPALVDRMDKAIATLWRGSSMGTVADSGAGISLQGKETALIEREDAEHIAGTLHTQVDRPALRFLFNTDQPRARVVIRHKESGLSAEELDTARDLLSTAIPKVIHQFVRRLMGKGDAPLSA
jgi:phage gp29-like protein